LNQTGKSLKDHAENEGLEKIETTRIL